MLSISSSTGDEYALLDNAMNSLTWIFMVLLIYGVSVRSKDMFKDFMFVLQVLCIGVLVDIIQRDHCFSFHSFGFPLKLTLA